MDSYSEEYLDSLYQNEEFLSEYDEFMKDNVKVNEFKKFIDGIELNTKYFRLTLHKVGKNRRYKNQNLGEDTIAIKEINSLLNKLTDRNLQDIQAKILVKLNKKDYLMKMMIQNIIEKCIVHTNYIPMYIDLIVGIYGDNNGVKKLVIDSTDQLYTKIQGTETSAEQSDYLKFCDKNKKLDKLIGHSILMTELEKKKIVQGKIHPILEDFISQMKECTDNDEKYKCVQCLYSVFKTLYEDCLLPEGYIQQLDKLIAEEKSMKIKFKMMDIIDRK